MLRRRVPDLLVEGNGVRSLHISASLYTLQHKDRILGTHGAGLVQHESMATMNLSRSFVKSVTSAAPAADRFRTKVHEGLGTSAADPYVRTLPNQESRLPESTVLQSASLTAPNLDEIHGLGQRWGTMNYWLGEQHPRLPLYVKSLLVSPALPVSPTAERMVGAFATEVIPKIGGDARVALEKFWSSAVGDFGRLNADYVFEKVTFERELEALHTRAVAEAEKISKDKEIVLALEVLRRKTILQRNAFIEQLVIPLVQETPYLGYGDAIWRVFLHAIHQQRSVLFNSDRRQALGYAWDSLMMADTIRTPSITAPVALLYALVSVELSHFTAPASLREKSAKLDEGVGQSGLTSAGTTSPYASVDTQLKRRVVTDAVTALLSTVQGCQELSKALRKAGKSHLAEEVALCEAMNDSGALLVNDVAKCIDRFDSTAEVKSLLASLLGGTDEAARQHLCVVFGISPKMRSVDWESVFSTVDWANQWRRLSTNLLANPAALAAIQKLVSNAIGAKGASKRLFCSEYATELDNVVRIRKERDEAHKGKEKVLVVSLSSYAAVDESIAMMESMESVSFETLRREAATELEGRQKLRQHVDEKMLDLLLASVLRRHPSWAKAGVVAPKGSVNAKQGHLYYVDALMRIFVRLTYVPQAGAAAIAQHTRRRVGQIGLEATQHNVPTEVGFVEHYDNLQYKRYDWQGWYQRMVDVHNRNVSVRCRLDDLKKLDSYGRPLVDLQTERRLRILAADRVGMGVLKLDSDKYEDRADNLTFGAGKLSELLADARKAQLGKEYWPTVEVKVRRPSGQSKTFYSIIDAERIEKKSSELYTKYRDAKKRSLFVTPMDMWLDVKGLQVRKSAETADVDGYTVDNLHRTLDGSDS